MSDAKENKAPVTRRRALNIAAGIAAISLTGVAVNEGVKEYQAWEHNNAQDKSLGKALDMQPPKKWNTLTGEENGAPLSSSKALELSAKASVDKDSALPPNYTPNEHNLPSESDMSNVDLSGISSGAGYGSDSIDWGTIPRSTFRIPEVNLSIPVVEKGATLRYERPNATGGMDRKYDVDVPVSFQAGHLNTSAPITAPKGTSYFFAHTNWANEVPAPFSSIKLAKKGMKVQTTDDAGNLVEWVITETGRTSQKDLDATLGIDDLETEKRLIATTCDKDSGGRFTVNAWIIAKPKS